MDRPQQGLHRGPLGIRRARGGEDRSVHGPLGDGAYDDPLLGLGRHQLRQQRDGLPVGDDRQADHAVVGPVANVGVESAELAAGPVDHLLPSGAGMARGPGLAGELGERHRAGVTARHRVVSGEDEIDRLAVQVVALHPCGPRVWLVLPLVGQDQVDVAERERGQRLFGLGLHELAAQPRRFARERTDGRHREPEAHRLKRRDTAPSGDAARGLGQLCLRHLGPLE
jgi:hypothetical protein